MTDTTPEDDRDISVQISLYPSDGEQKGLRQIGVGIQPFVILEVGEIEGTDDVGLFVTGSLVDTLDELVETLESFTEAVREAVANHQENEAEEAADRG